MKLITAMMFLFVSLASMAGTLIQKDNPDNRIHFEIDGKTLNFTLEKDGVVSEKSVPFSKFEISVDDQNTYLKKNLGVHINSDGNYEYTNEGLDFLVKFWMTRTLLDDLYDSPGYIIFTPVTFIVDVVLMPVKFTVGGIRGVTLNKDLRLLTKAIKTDKEVVVKKSRFNRILYYMKMSKNIKKYN